MTALLQFDKYLLQKKIAVGGMAEVFRAKLKGEEGFEKLVVIKRMLPHLSEEEQMVKHFIDEARLAARLKHENIIHVYDFGNHQGAYYIAMEYLFGKDLHILWRKSQDPGPALDLSNLLYIVAKICEGLDYAHGLTDLKGTPLNIIHRDVSPHNIFITYEGNVKIIDFGIAKAASHSSKTRVGVIKGKAAYMSPEQAEGKGMDHRSDIYAVGIILYELLAQRKMFEGDTFEVLAKVREARFEPLESIVPDLPQPLYEILRKALAKNPEERYSSGEAMQLDIEDCLEQFHLRSHPKKLAEYMQLVFRQEYEKEKAELADALADTAAGPDGDGDQATMVMDFGPDQTMDRQSDETIIQNQAADPAGSLLKKILSTATRSNLVIISIVLACLTLTASVAYYQRKSLPAGSPTESSGSSEPARFRSFWSTEKPLTPERREEIQKWLELAEVKLKKNQLTSPADDCAYYYYSLVLKQEADHPQAKEGLRKIVAAYVRLAENEMNRMNRRKALNFIQAGLAIDPEDKRLLALKNDASNEGTMLVRKLKRLF